MEFAAVKPCHREFGLDEILPKFITLITAPAAGVLTPLEYIDKAIEIASRRTRFLLVRDMLACRSGRICSRSRRRGDVRMVYSRRTP